MKLPEDLLFFDGRSSPDPDNFLRVAESSSLEEMLQMKEDAKTISKRIKQWHAFIALLDKSDRLKFAQYFTFSRRIMLSLALLNHLVYAPFSNAV